MGNHGLTLGAMMELCERAGEALADRLKAIREEADPADQALHELLEGLADQQRDHVETIRAYRYVRGFSELQGLSTFDARRLIKSNFPSLAHRFGEGYLDRDRAMHFAETLEEEASRFYRELAQQAPDDDSRLFFGREALCELGQLARLRTVLL